MRFYWFLFFAIVVFAPRSHAQSVGSWSNTGPVNFPVNVSGQVDGIGRVCQIKFHPTNAQKMYAVSASGGLFISNNNGVSWNVTAGSDQLPSTQCASVCINYTNDNILYLSTGDPNYYYEDYGIWKSTDGGVTWNPSNSNIGNRMAVEMIMSPINPNVIVAATDDGIWKTIDGGNSWAQKYIGGDFKDMKMRPNSVNEMYAVTSSGFFKSLNMGDSWIPVTSGITIPQNNDGLRIAVSNSNPPVVYVATTGDNGVVMRSLDGGQTFSTVYSSATDCLVCYDENPASGSQGNYNFGLTANPLNADELLLVAHCVWRSTDGGFTWSRRTDWYDQVHTDMHQIQFNPYNNQQRFNANDGGVWLSTDTLATTWSTRSDGLACTEVYHASQSPVIRQMVSIGTQDNGELYYDNTWKCYRGGDWGSRSSIDYSVTATVYYMENGDRRNLLPLGGDQSFNCPFDPSNSATIEFLPKMHNVAFAGKDSLWRSSDVNTPSPTWSFLFTPNTNMKGIASCRADSNIFYVVTNDDKFYRSDNALAPAPSFNIHNTPSSTGARASIATSRYNSNIVYLSCGSSIYRSTNKGVTWSDITNNLPNLNINKVIADDYSTTERLFVNLGSYVYYKDNSTSNWTLIPDLPTVPDFKDLMIFNDSTAASILRIASYGRGVWEVPIFNNLPPVIALQSDKQYICPADTIRFSKTIFGPFSSFTWHFPGGSPATSTLDSPIVMYPAIGDYDVSMIVAGSSGPDTLTLSNYIHVSNGLVTGVQEGFEGTVFPPSGWTLFTASGENWQPIDTVGGFGLSTHSIMFDNYNHDAGGRHDRFLLPEIDLTNATSAYLTFEVAYAYYSGYHDSLEVQLSTDCGKTFIPVYEKDSTGLATAANTTNYFVPTATEWRKDSISLNAFIGNTVQLSFDNVGHYGQPVYIDNINLQFEIPATGVAAVAGNTLSVYPNPSTGVVYVKAEGMKTGNVTVSVYNITGARVYERPFPAQNGTLQTTLDLSQNAPGIYEIRIRTEDGRSLVKKLILQ